MNLPRRIIPALVVSALLLAGVEMSRNGDFRYQAPDIKALPDNVRTLWTEDRRGERLATELREILILERATERIYDALTAGHITLARAGALFCQLKTRPAWEKAFAMRPSIAHGATFEERLLRHVRSGMTYWLQEYPHERECTLRRLDEQLAAILENGAVMSLAEEGSPGVTEDR